MPESGPREFGWNAGCLRCWGVLILAGMPSLTWTLCQWRYINPCRAAQGPLLCIQLTFQCLPHIQLVNLPPTICIHILLQCEYVCVCEREKERGVSFRNSLFLQKNSRNVGHACLWHSLYYIQDLLSHKNFCSNLFVFIQN